MIRTDELEEEIIWKIKKVKALSIWDNISFFPRLTSWKFSSAIAVGILILILIRF